MPHQGELRGWQPGLKIRSSIKGYTY